jgi:hypothetical protein
MPLGLLFCLMGLSGSIILYRDAIEASLRPALESGRRATARVGPGRSRSRCAAKVANGGTEPNQLPARCR